MISFSISDLFSETAGTVVEGSFGTVDGSETVGEQSSIGGASADRSETPGVEDGGGGEIFGEDENFFFFFGEVFLGEGFFWGIFYSP